MEKAHLSINNPLIALSYKSFRLYWIGFFVSVIGSWMQNIAQPWLVYSITDSPFLLSLVGVIQTTPVILLSAFSGVMIDRYSRKKIILITQSVSFITTFFVAMLVWFDVVQYWHIFIAAFILGVTNSIDMPARQSFYVELVEKRDLMNAIALSSSAFNIARIIGPLISGFVIAYVGIALCFLINSISFLVMILCLSFIKPLSAGKERAEKRKQKILQDVIEGGKYIQQNKKILQILTITAVIGIFAFNFPLLLPVLVKTVLNSEAITFSYLMSFLGIGSFLGALIIASTSRAGPKPYVQALLPFVIGILLCATGIATEFLLIGILLSLTGLFAVMFSSSSNTTVQLNVEESFRGRVMSIYVLVFNGFSAFGNFLSGVIMERFNVQAAYLTCGIAIILLSGILALFRRRSKNIQVNQSIRI